MVMDSLMTCHEIAQQMHASDRTVNALMDQYRDSGGREGLPWLTLPGGKRRLVRSSTLSSYLAGLESATVVAS